MIMMIKMNYDNLINFKKKCRITYELTFDDITKPVVDMFREDTGCDVDNASEDELRFRLKQMLILVYEEKLK